VLGETQLAVEAELGIAEAADTVESEVADGVEELAGEELEVEA
jgi:hypothetical protein